MTTYLLSQPTIDSFLSEKISQDPLEKFFGIQRQRGRVNENPNMSEFCQNTQALRVINSVSWKVARGNTCGGKDDGEEEVVSDEPLAKRRRQTKKNDCVTLFRTHSSLYYHSSILHYIKKGIVGITTHTDTEHIKPL